MLLERLANKRGGLGVGEQSRVVIDHHAGVAGVHVAKASDTLKREGGAGDGPVHLDRDLIAEDKVEGAIAGRPDGHVRTMVSEEIETRDLQRFGQRLDADRTHVSYFDEDSVKRTGLERIVQGNRDHVSGRSRMPQPDVAPLLPDHIVSQSLEDWDQTVGRYTAR
jgi:hypothetical protein